MALRWGCAIGAALSAAAGLAEAGAAATPNVLLLMADQFRWDALGAYGVNNATNTPNLDGLARDGLLFRRAYSSTPTCTPARAALLTGRSPWYHGMLGYGEIATNYSYEMPATLAAAGITTAQIGKNHFSWNKTEPLPMGYGTNLVYDGLGTGFPSGGNYDSYDKWFQTQLPGQNPLASGGLDWNSWGGAPYQYDERLHPTAWVRDNAVAWLKNYSAAGRSAPFFLKVSFHRPHSPYDPPSRLLNATNSVPPVHVGGNWDSTYANDPACGPKDPDAWCGAMPADAAHLARRAYHANIAFVDESIGAVLAQLEASGLANNTFIFFISDHGDGQGDHNLWRKGYPYELSSHVPFIVRWPSTLPGVTIPRGSTSDAIVELRDVFPTVLDVVGIAPPATERLDGLPITCLLRDPSGASCKPLTPLSSAPAQGWRQSIDLEHDIVYNETIHWNALTDGATKYVFWAFSATEQLFNLTSDPNEMNDVSAEPAYAQVLAEWRGRMVAQFEAEKRGPTWVDAAKGVLLQRVQGQLYSPYYP